MVRGHRLQHAADPGDARPPSLCRLPACQPGGPSRQPLGDRDARPLGDPLDGHRGRRGLRALQRPRARGALPPLPRVRGAHLADGSRRHPRAHEAGPDLDPPGRDGRGGVPVQRRRRRCRFCRARLLGRPLGFWRVRAPADGPPVGRPPVRAPGRRRNPARPGRGLRGLPGAQEHR